MFCQKCGARLVEDANFCGCCGHTKKIAEDRIPAREMPSSELSDQDMIEAARQYMSEFVTDQRPEPEVMPIQGPITEAVQIQQSVPETVPAQQYVCEAVEGVCASPICENSAQKSLPMKRKLPFVMAAVVIVAVAVTIVGVFVVPNLFNKDNAVGEAAAEGSFQLMSSVVTVREEGKSEQRVTYNDRGFVEEEVYYTDSVESGRNKYYYDGRDNVVKFVSTSTGGTERCTEYKYDENDNRIERVIYSDGVKEKSYTYKYDSSGNKTEEIELDGNNNVKYKNGYKYNGSGDITEEQTTYSDGKVSLKEYKYDGNGNLTEKTHRNSDGTVYRYEYEFDSDGNEVEEIYSVDNIIYTTTKNSYDSNGNKKESICYGDFGEVRWRYVYSYDEKSNLIGQITYDEDGEISYRIFYKYDAQGNLIEKSREDEDGETTKETYSFNGNNQLVENVSYKNGVEISRVTVEFSSHRVEDDKKEKIKAQQEDVFYIVTVITELDL